MADGLSVAAAALQVAQLGFEIAQKLYNYSKDVKNATENINRLADDVGITSDVLTEVNIQLGAGQAGIKDEARQRAYRALNSCRSAFRDIVDLLMSGVKIDKDGEKLIVTTTVKLSWPFKSRQLADLRKQMEWSKSTLTLIMTVLGLKESRKSGDRANAVLQQVYIQTLGAQLNSYDAPDDIKATAGSDRGVVGPNVSGAPAGPAPIYARAKMQEGSKDEVTSHLFHFSHIAAELITTIAKEASQWQLHEKFDIERLGKLVNGTRTPLNDLQIAYGQFFRLQQKKIPESDREHRTTPWYFDEEHVKRFKQEAKAKEQAEKKYNEELARRKKEEEMRMLEHQAKDKASRRKLEFDERQTRENMLKDTEARFKVSSDLSISPAPHDEDEDEDEDEGDRYSSGVDIVEHLLRRWTVDDN